MRRNTSPAVGRVLVWLVAVVILACPGASFSEMFPRDTAVCLPVDSKCAEELWGSYLELPEYGIQLELLWNAHTALCPDPVAFVIVHDLLYLPEPPPAESLPYQAGLLKVWQEGSEPVTEDGKLLDVSLMTGKRRCGIPYERIHDDTFWVEGPTFRYTDLEYRIFEHDLDVDTIYMAVRNITLDSLWLRFDTTSFFGDTGVWVGTMDRPKRSPPGPMFRRPAKVLAVHDGRRLPGPYGVFDIRGREVRARRSRGLVIVR